MTLQLHYAQRGQLREQMARDAKAIQEAMAATTKWAADTEKALTRAQVAPLMGRRAANAIRSRVYRNTDGAAGHVYSKLGRGRPTAPDFDDYLLPWVVGMTIRPLNGKFMLIAPGKRKRLTAAQRAALFDNPKVRIVPGKRGQIYFITQSRTRSRLLAIGIRQYHRPRRLSVARIEKRLEAQMPRRFAEEVNKRLR